MSTVFCISFILSLCVTDIYLYCKFCLWYRFESAHIVDLFGAAGSGMSKDKDFKLNRNKHLGPLKFTDDMVKNMFKALDLDGDTFISKRDLELWLRNQKVGKANGFAGVLEFDEIDAFLHGGRLTLENEGPSMTNGISKSKRPSVIKQSSARGLMHPENSLAGMLDRSFHTKSSQKLVGGDLNEVSSPLHRGEALLSREDLGKCLSRLVLHSFSTLFCLDVPICPCIHFLSSFIELTHINLPITV